MENKITYCGEVVAQMTETDCGNVFCPTNKVILVGKILNEFKYSHKKFYRLKVRLGEGQENCVWVYVPENLAIWKMQNYSKLQNRYVEIAGEFRESDDSTAGVYVSYFKVFEEQQEYKECCYLQGEIKELFLGKVVDMTLKVCSGDGRTDMIKCIAYKNKAKQACKLKLGTNVEILGEIQRVTTEKNGNERIRNPRIIIRKMRKWVSM